MSHCLCGAEIKKKRGMNMERAIKLTRTVDSNGYSMDILRRKKFEISVKADKALFCTPDSKGIGAPRSYIIPNINQLEGMLKNIYWHQGIQPYIDAIRVMNPLPIPMFRSMYELGVSGTNTKKSHPIILNSYIWNVWYKIRFHLEWDPLFENLDQEINTVKQWQIMERRIYSPRKPVYLGRSECIASVEETKFLGEPGAYDGTGEFTFSMMPLRILYAEVSGNNEIRRADWHPKMVNGIIRVPSIEDIKKEDTVVIGNMAPVIPAHMREEMGA